MVSPIQRAPSSVQGRKRAPSMGQKPVGELSMIPWHTGQNDLEGLAVVMGGAKDGESRDLAALLAKYQHPSVSGVGKWDFVKCARVLAGSMGYLGNDTGLAHLAEAMGVPAVGVPIVNFDNNQHGENENLRMGTFFDGITTLAAVLTAPLPVVHSPERRPATRPGGSRARR